jgi:2-phospho-L-lactate guanylyltransferase (CobY/MobA/RfbA family)
MRITKDDIRIWLEEAQEDGATHVVIRSDDFSHEYYPCKCFSEEEARMKADESGNMQRTIEVYNLSEDWDEQLDTDRNFSY